MQFSKPGVRASATAYCGGRETDGDGCQCSCYQEILGHYCSQRHPRHVCPLVIHSFWASTLYNLLLLLRSLTWLDLGKQFAETVLGRTIRGEAHERNSLRCVGGWNKAHAWSPENGHHYPENPAPYLVYPKHRNRPGYCFWNQTLYYSSVCTLWPSNSMRVWTTSEWSYWVKLGVLCDRCVFMRLLCARLTDSIGVC